MANIYFVKTVNGDKVVGLALATSDGSAFIGTLYASSGKTGREAPTTVEDVKRGVESDIIPIVGDDVIQLLGMSRAGLAARQSARAGEVVYYEHALAV